MNDFDLPSQREQPPDVQQRLVARLSAEIGTDLDSATRRTVNGRTHDPVDTVDVGLVSSGDVVVIDLRPEATSARRVRAHRLVPAVAAAAILGLVAVSIAFMNTSVNEPVSAPSSATDDPEAPLRTAVAELDRCWTALERAGVPAGFPERATWQPLLTEAYDHSGVRVTAARAEGKPLLCQTTATSVVLSDPDATPGLVPGSDTGVLLSTPEGVLAGTLDPDWQQVTVNAGNAEFPVTMTFPDTESRPGSPSFSTEAQWLMSAVSESASGIFVLSIGNMDRTQARITDHRFIGPANQADAHPLPIAPAPALTVTDRPDAPPRPRVPADTNADEADLSLAGCVSWSTLPAAHLFAWRPGAWLPDTEARLMVARAGDRTAVCNEATRPTENWEPMSEPVEIPVPGPDDPPVILASPTQADDDGATVAIAGVVSPRAERVTVELDERTYTGDVVDSTFLIAVPDGHGLDDLTFTVTERNGNIRYVGPADSVS